MRQINDYVEAMFSTLPKTKEVIDIKLQILGHMEERYEALLEQGKNENEALGTVIAEFGSIDELKQEYGIRKEAPLCGSDRDEELDRLLREQAAFVPKSRMALAAAVMLFILSPVCESYLDSVMLFFLMIALGVGLLIYFQGRRRDYQELIRERSLLLGTHTQELQNTNIQGGDLSERP